MREVSIKCLAFDVDGTLTNSQKKIDQRTLLSIQKAMDRGLHIVISSGRNKESCEFVYKPLHLEDGPHFLSLINGQKIYNFQKKELQTSRLLNTEEVLYIQRVCRKYKCVIRFTLDNEAYYMLPITKMFKYGIKYLKKKIFRKNHSMLTSTKYKVTIIPYRDYIFENEINKIVVMNSKEFFEQNYEKIKSELSNFEAMMVGDGWMEIMPQGVNKANALRIIAQENGFLLENIMAFGDAQNDISMIQECGIGVAMGNAREEVKEVADMIADTNDNNGIGKIIDQYILGE